MQKAKFIMDTYNLSQGYDGNTKSHNGTYAMDICGKDGGIENAYAPFDCYVSKIYKKAGVANTIWFSSYEKVMCADGVARFLTIMLVHKDDISGYYVGQRYNQGSVFYCEGKSGYATGNHIHLELGGGQNLGWHQNKYGIWMIDNALKPDEMLMINDNTNVKNVMYNGYNYTMKNEKSVIIDSDYNYRGCLDWANETSIHGWAYNGKDDTPLLIHNYIYKNGVHIDIAVANADQHREDLAPAGIGNGYHAFNLDWDFYSKYGNGDYTIQSYLIGGSNPRLSGEIVVKVNRQEEPIVEPAAPIVEDSIKEEEIEPQESSKEEIEPIIDNNENNTNEETNNTNNEVDETIDNESKDKTSDEQKKEEETKLPNQNGIIGSIMAIFTMAFVFLLKYWYIFLILIILGVTIYEFIKKNNNK